MSIGKKQVLTLTYINMVGFGIFLGNTPPRKGFINRLLRQLYFLNLSKQLPMPYKTKHFEIQLSCENYNLGKSLMRKYSIIRIKVYGDYSILNTYNSKIHQCVSMIV